MFFNNGQSSDRSQPLQVNSAGSASDSVFDSKVESKSGSLQSKEKPKSPVKQQESDKAGDCASSYLIENQSNRLENDNQLINQPPKLGIKLSNVNSYEAANELNSVHNSPQHSTPDSMRLS